MSLTDVFRPSGGFYYHWRAFWNRRQWADFTNQIHNWLEDWPTKESREELVLLGPSAGYSLPTKWLKSFKKITAYDLDPLAPVLFQKVHTGVPAKFIKQDLFWQQGQLSLDPLQKILATHPSAVILFCNVLGQVLLEGHASEEEWSRYLLDLRQMLRTRRWASYHDICSQRKNTRIDHLMTGAWNADLAKQQTRWQFSKSTHHDVEFVKGQD